MKKILLSLSAIVALSTTSQADFLGAEVGIASWQADITGDIKKGTNSLELQDDLGFGDNKSNNFFYASFEHPIPLIPNIKIQHTKLDQSANGTMSKSVTFSNKTFNANDKVSTDLQLNQTDFIFYYEILDNWVNLDLGLNAKYLDASISVKSTTQKADESISAVIPMLYTKAKFDMPFTGLSAEADISYISIAGSTFSDIKAGLVYEASYGLGATIGYRQEKLTIDDIDDIYSNIDTSGYYVGLFYHF